MNTKKQVLIADDDDDLLQSLSIRCKGLGLDVITARDAMDALANADFYAPDLAILDVRMPGGNGISVSEMMATDDRLNATSVIVMTGDPSELIEQRCQEMGARLVKKDQQIWTRIEPIIREVLGHDGPTTSITREALSDQQVANESADQHPEQGGVVMSLLEELGWVDAETATREGVGPDDAADEDQAGVASEDQSPWVLAIDDDPDFSIGLQKRLLTYGVQLVRAYRGMEGYRVAFRGRPAAILLDYHMPDGNGEYILRRLKESSATDCVPVIVITGFADASLKRRMLAGGASDFLGKPVTWEQLRRTLKQYTDLNLNQPVVRTAELAAGGC